ncbi:MAG: DUF6263 family protein [Thermoguttaceae bacterium]|jgi:hypothetical protein
MKIKTFTRLFSLWIVLLTAQTVLGADDEQYAILNSWEKGSYTLLQECTSTLYKKANAAEAERDDSRALFNWQIEAGAEGSDGIQKFSMKLLRIMTSVRVNGREIIYYDSSNGLSRIELLNAIFKQMKETETIVVFKNGVPMEVLGCENYWKDIPEPTDDFEKFLLNHMKSFADPDNIKQTFETLVYLDTPNMVAVGDKWTNKTVLPVPVIGDKTLEWDCSLNKIKRSGGVPLASVTGKGVLNFSVAEPLRGDVVVKMENSADYDTKSYYATHVDSRVTVNVKTMSPDSEDTEQFYAGFLKNKLTIAKH